MFCYHLGGKKKPHIHFGRAMQATGPQRCVTLAAIYIFCASKKSQGSALHRGFVAGSGGKQNKISFGVSYPEVKNSLP